MGNFCAEQTEQSRTENIQRERKALAHYYYCFTLQREMMRDIPMLVLLPTTLTVRQRRCVLCVREPKIYLDHHTPHTHTETTHIA